MRIASRGSRLLGVVMAGVTAVSLLAPPPILAQDVQVADTFTVVDRRNDQLYPRLAGRHVVWQDYRDIGSHDGDAYNADIWGRNLDTGDEFLVESNRTSSYPDVSGNIVVFADNRNGDVDIRAYDIRQRDRFWVVRREGSIQDRPSISGNIVVWQDNRDGFWSIRAKDLDRDEEFWVSRRDSNQTNPRIAGNLVVWEDDRDGCCDIYAKNLDNGDVFRVTGSNDAREPDIDGHWVVYRREKRTHDDVEAYNLASGERLRLNGSTSDRRGQPTISGEVAVWADRRNDDDFNIFGYSFASGEEFSIVRQDANQQAPTISGSRVVWTDDRSDRGIQLRGAVLALPADEDDEPITQPTIPAPPITGSVQQGPCGFQLGFEMLRNAIIAQYGNIVGECLENEWHNAINGDALQQTTGGLMVWRKADNWTAFTNGSITWLNGPCGLQTRPNQGPFYAWEGVVGGVCR